MIEAAALSFGNLGNTPTLNPTGLHDVPQSKENSNVVHNTREQPLRCLRRAKAGDEALKEWDAVDCSNSRQVTSANGVVSIPPMHSHDADAKAAALASLLHKDHQERVHASRFSLVLTADEKLGPQLARKMGLDADASNEGVLKTFDVSSSQAHGFLNPFGARLNAVSDFDRELVMGSAVDIQIWTLERLVDRQFVNAHRHALWHLLRLLNEFENSNLSTLVTLLQPGAVDRFSNVTRRIRSQSTQRFIQNAGANKDFDHFSKAFEAALEGKCKNNWLRQQLCRSKSATKLDRMILDGKIVVFNIEENSVDFQ